jgi:hypothetical protein
MPQEGSNEGVGEKRLSWPARKPFKVQRSSWGGSEVSSKEACLKLLEESRDSLMKMSQIIKKDRVGGVKNSWARSCRKSRQKGQGLKSQPRL